MDILQAPTWGHGTSKKDCVKVRHNEEKMQIQIKNIFWIKDAEIIPSGHLSDNKFHMPGN